MEYLTLHHQPHGGARRKYRGSLKALGYIPLRTFLFQNMLQFSKPNHGSTAPSRCAAVRDSGFSYVQLIWIWNKTRLTMRLGG